MTAPLVWLFWPFLKLGEKNKETNNYTCVAADEKQNLAGLGVKTWSAQRLRRSTCLAIVCMTRPSQSSTASQVSAVDETAATDEQVGSQSFRPSE